MIRGASSCQAGAPGDQNLASVPPPTKVGNAPQASTTVNGTVVGWPSVARSTVKVSAAVLAGAETTWLLAIDWPFEPIVISEKDLKWRDFNPAYHLGQLE